MSRSPQQHRCPRYSPYVVTRVAVGVWWCCLQAVVVEVLVLVPVLSWCSSFVCAVRGYVVRAASTAAVTAQRVAADVVHRASAGAALGSKKDNVGGGGEYK